MLIPSVTASSQTKEIKKPVTVEKSGLSGFFSVSEIRGNVDFVIFSTKSQEKRLQKQFRPFCTGSYARPIGRLHPALRQRDRLDFRPTIPRPRKNILDRSQRCRSKLLWAGKCIDYPFGEIRRFETMGKKSAESTLSGVLLRDHECRELVYAQQLRTVRPPDYIRRRYHH